MNRRVFLGTAALAAGGVVCGAESKARRELLSFLYRHTEGNPLFVVQVLRTLVDEGAVWYTGERWEWRPVSELRLPVGVGDLISRRLGRLS